MKVCSLSLSERVGVRGYGLSLRAAPPHPDRKSDPTSPHRGEVKQTPLTKRFD